MTRPTYLPNWRLHAACRDQSPDLFHGHGGTVTAARRVCAECRVAAECLAAALLDPEHCLGVWGGLPEGPRDRLRRLLRAEGPFAHLPPEVPHPAQEGLTRAERQRVLAEELGGNYGRRLRRGEALRLARRFGVARETISHDLKVLRERVSA